MAHQSTVAVLPLRAPFDLALSLKAAASFLPAQQAVPTVLKVAINLAEEPAIIEVRQHRCQLEALGPARLNAARLREIAGWLVNADLDLRPFYELGAAHPALGPVTRALGGLKPLRPASLFEMLVIAITEQQLSLAAAFHIRRRLVESFGSRVDGIWLFPTPASLAAAPLAALKACGLSEQKAGYIAALAGEITAGRLDVAALKAMDDPEVRSILARQRGLGEWSIDYVLSRGLGRLDCLPAGDVGLRRVVGRYLCGGARLSPEELAHALAPFAPYRSLAAYYFAAHARLFPGRPGCARGARHWLMPQRKALLLRVGIDRGTGGALSPIFADGSIEYVPIPEMRPTRCSVSFATFRTRSGRSLAEFLPRRIAGRIPHIDPDFDAFTYGDAAPHKSRQLLRLNPADLLVFYAGFEPWPRADIPRLFVIGWFEVKEAHDLRVREIASDPTLRARFGNTAHFLRDPSDPELALIEGDPCRSRFLERALPLGDGEDLLLRDLAAFGYRGSLRRAVGHWLHGAAVTALEDWLHRGLESLIDDRTRIFDVPTTKIKPAPPGCRRGDLVAVDTRPRLGDWIWSREQDTFLLARINERAPSGELGASLFWYLQQPDPALRDPMPAPEPRRQPEPRGDALRRLVSWVASHYRIGVHSP